LTQQSGIERQIAPPLKSGGRNARPMNFEIISEITEIEPIAIGSSIHDIRRLRRTYGKGRWRKLKGMA
jgi:hypothetical protein